MSIKDKQSDYSLRYQISCFADKDGVEAASHFTLEQELGWSDTARVARMPCLSHGGGPH